MELSDLAIFQAVLQEGGITAAARRLHRVQSNITTRIKQLEDSLGVALFERDGRGVRPTAAAQVLAGYSERLLALADEAVAATGDILAANALDLAALETSNPLYDRLLLTPERIKSIANDIRNVAALPSPLGKTLMETERPNGMKITKISVPFGVVGIIYEARPNVSFDVFSLCFKSGNTCVLKGGSDAFNSNRAIVELIKNVLRKHELDENTVTLLPAGREAAAELMNAAGTVDVIIPRGGKG